MKRGNEKRRSWDNTILGNIIERAWAEYTASYNLRSVPLVGDVQQKVNDEVNLGEARLSQRN